jgi:hypothetical protein
MIRKILFISCFMIFKNMVTGQTHNTTAIIFNFNFNQSPFQLEKEYITYAGESIQVYKMKFYISGLTGVTVRGDTLALSKEHFLIDVADSSSQLIKVQAPQLQYLFFTIGVDSLKNTSGIQNGVLDPSRGMFWTWNSGYIMAKLEGVSSQANTAGNRFTHDVGGFRSPFNSTRKIRLLIPQNKINNTSVYIEVNLAKWFSGKYPILLKEQPICHTPSLLAMQLADNFVTSFTTSEN